MPNRGVVNRLAPFAFSLAVGLAFWWGVSKLMESRLVPGVGDTFHALGGLLATGQAWQDICITVFRGVGGLGLSVFAALLLGIPAGLSKRVMELLGPLVAALQACPPVLWISLLLVWCGTGSVVPLGVVFASLFPPMFANVAGGVAAIDHRLFQMARIYNVGRFAVLKEIVLPGMLPFFLAGLSYALGTCWKITAVAEFLGSGTGMGSRIYWTYRMLEMPQLFAWGLLLVILGMGLELGVVRPLRLAAEKKGGSGA